LTIITIITGPLKLELCMAFSSLSGVTSVYWAQYCTYHQKFNFIFLQHFPVKVFTVPSYSAYEA